MVVQFSLSVLLIIGTGVIWQQIQYMKSQDLHLDAEGVYAVKLSPEYFEKPESAARKIETFKEKMLQYPGIQQVSFFPATFPVTAIFGDTTLRRKGPTKKYGCDGREMT